MPVRAGGGRHAVEANHVYVIPPGKYLSISAAHAAADRADRAGRHPHADRPLPALAGRGPRRSGRSASSCPAPGTDGTLGLQADQGGRRDDDRAGPGHRAARRHAAQRDRRREPSITSCPPSACPSGPHRFTSGIVRAHWRGRPRRRPETSRDASERASSPSCTSGRGSTSAATRGARSSAASSRRMGLRHIERDRRLRAAAARASRPR